MVDKFSRRFMHRFFLAGMLFVQAACTTTSEMEVSTAVPVEPQLTATMIPTTIPPSDQIASRIGVVNPVTIYSGPGIDYPRAGVFEAGTNAQVIETREGGWMKTDCPDGIAGSCWVVWDMNDIHSYEGLPITLNIPDPASLKIESTNETTSPDGRWQALVTQTERVPLDGEYALFFHTELIVTSLVDGTTWKLVSEWHMYGIGHEYAPMPFHWSQDGRYLYYTSFFDLHGACVSMNIGERLDRLDLTDGIVTSLQPPRAFRLLSISPDETKVAYLGGQSMVNFTNQQVLIVRELAQAYAESSAGQDPLLWEITLDIAWPTPVSEIAWSPDSRKILVTATTLADEVLCNQASVTTWELDMATGEFAEVSNTVFPTATP